MYSVEEIRLLISNNQKVKFYKDRYWIKLATRILERDNNECQMCAKEGKLSIKQHGKKLDIHHIKELETNPECAYDENNLLTVCVHHHNELDNKNFTGTRTKKFINEERW